MGQTGDSRRQGPPPSAARTAGASAGPRARPRAAAARWLKEALFWQPLEGGRVQCQLCPHGCRIAEGKVGLCRVRQNTGGVLRSLNYGRVSSVNMDPIEKKPLFHFHPGATILSLGTVGCNLACAFCQNWAISQSDEGGRVGGRRAFAGTRRMPPQEAVRLAQSCPNNLGIAYTYNEPFIWYEFVAEAAEAARSAGLKNVLVTNGYVQEEPLRRLLPFVDAMNVDIKSVRDAFYRELCRGHAEPPRRTVEIAKELGCLVEITNLVIPNWNDSEEDLKALVEWAAGVDVDMPLHFSRYHPDYKMTEPPTSSASLAKARDMAQEKLHYVYLGNLWSGEGEDTRCHHCGKVVVARHGFSVGRVSVAGGKCEFCGGALPIVGL